MLKMSIQDDTAQEIRSCARFLSLQFPVKPNNNSINLDEWDHLFVSEDDVSSNYLDNGSDDD